MEESSGPVVQTALAQTALAQTALAQTPLAQTALGESPFGDLVSHWLDEGDRLSASAADAAAPAPATENRLGHVIERLRPVFARHRLLVFAAIGLLPLALIVLPNRGGPAQVPATTVALAFPMAASGASEARSVPSPAAQTAPESRPAPAPTPSSATTTAPPAAAKLASVGVAGSNGAPSQHHHHHHHHHHAASAPGNTIASVGRSARR